MPVLNHTHKYIATCLGSERIERNELGKKVYVKTSGYPIFKCSLDNCSHFTLKNLAEGRESVCWKCNEKMIMKKYNLNQIKPHHRECNRRK